MTDTHHLALPLIAAAQAQKHVTHNEALRSLDALVMLSIEDRDLTAPPDSPDEGARYLVQPTGAGAFAGKDGMIAHFRDGAFAFHAPQAGWIAYVADENAVIVFDGAQWSSLFGENLNLQNIALLGLGTLADAEKPLSAKLNKALWTARYDGEGGDGDLRYMLNKEAADKVLSLLMHSDWSGRAEIGLIGDDDLTVKVSADGSDWKEAMIVDRDSGQVRFPHGVAGLRERLTAPRTYYVRTDGDDGNDGLSNDTGGAFATIQKAVDVVFGTLDLDVFDVTIQLADGTYSAGAKITAPRIGAGSVTIQGNATSPGNVVVTAATPAFACFRTETGASLFVRDLEMRATGGNIHCLQTEQGGFIGAANVVFGTCGGFHIRCGNNACVNIISTSYAITGGAVSHWNCALSGSMAVQANTITLTGTPNFSSAFAQGIINACLGVNSNTFVGGATGKRYSATGNSVINTNGGGASYLPGDVAGTTGSGGQYV